MHLPCACAGPHKRIPHARMPVQCSATLGLDFVANITDAVAGTYEPAVQLRYGCSLPGEGASCPMLHLKLGPPHSSSGETMNILLPAAAAEGAEEPPLLNINVTAACACTKSTGEVMGWPAMARRLLGTPSFAFQLSSCQCVRTLPPTAHWHAFLNMTTQTWSHSSLPCPLGQTPPGSSSPWKTRPWASLTMSRTAR